jgi:cytochrome c556
MLAEAEAGTKALRAAVAAKPVDAGAADAAFKRVAGACASCHKGYRD